MGGGGGGREEGGLTGDVGAVHQMVVQILAYAWQVDLGFDTGARQQLFRADAAALQDLRAVEGARREDDFFARLDPRLGLIG